MKKEKKIIVGNWKMNPTSADWAKKIFQSTKKIAAKNDRVEVVVCPPFVYALPLSKISRGQVAVGAQDVFHEMSGSYTGEISALMLSDAGLTHVIVGHSERRKMGETDESVNKKSLAVLQGGLTLILCVGESNRDSEGAYLKFIADQIKSALAKAEKKHLKKLIIAYEPVWAIGKSDAEAMKPEDMHETGIYIKKVLSDMFGKEEASRVPVLYGGSVSPRNAGELIEKGNVSGLLVGRDSLNPENFAEIIKLADASARKN